MGEISVPPEFDELIAGLVTSGRYASPKEVVAAAMRLLDEEERARAAQIEQMRRDVAEAIAEDERDDVVDADEYLRQLGERIEKMARGAES
jgi:putative addiction module CopG family antidote